MRKRTNYRDSTFKTLEILRASDRVMDSISDMGSPSSIWKQFIRTAKRELLYAFAIAWQGPAIALIWLGVATFVLWLL